MRLATFWLATLAISFLCMPLKSFSRENCAKLPAKSAAYFSCLTYNKTESADEDRKARERAEEKDREHEQYQQRFESLMKRSDQIERQQASSSINEKDSKGNNPDLDWLALKIQVANEHTKAARCTDAKRQIDIAAKMISEGKGFGHYTSKNTGLTITWPEVWDANVAVNVAYILQCQKDYDYLVRYLSLEAQNGSSVARTLLGELEKSSPPLTSSNAPTKEVKKTSPATKKQSRGSGPVELHQVRAFKDCGDCPEMLSIPAGSFEMGSRTGGSDEKPVRIVKIKEPFALGKTEVTQYQWRVVMGGDPPNLKFKGCDNCPVEGVDWNAAQTFVRELGKKTGKKYRLPSEAEWEYACRAGGTHIYCGSDNADSVAWHDGNGGGRTHQVATKQANAWGLYDMTGNVHEWVEDCFSSTYTDAPKGGFRSMSEILAAPTGTTGAFLSWREGDCGYRGGSWDDKPSIHSRSTQRSMISSSVESNSGYIGFRVARTLP